MVQRTFSTISGWQAALWAVGLGVAAATIAEPSRAQTGFQIVWVVIGEAASAGDKSTAHAGRQLFMASDLVSKSLANVKVEQVDVTPIVHQLAVGDRLCFTSLDIRTLGPGKEP